jgi:Periplasmic binding protein
LSILLDACDRTAVRLGDYFLEAVRTDVRGRDLLARRHLDILGGRYKNYNSLQGEFMRSTFGKGLLAFLFGVATCAGATAADTIKIAHIDPQSGPFALQGQSGDRHIQQAIDEINARGGVLGGTKLELVSLDNKSSPQESLVALKQAIDQAIRYVTQGNGSHVGHALTEAVNCKQRMVNT